MHLIKVWATYHTVLTEAECEVRAANLSTAASGGSAGRGNEKQNMTVDLDIIE